MLLIRAGHIITMTQQGSFAGDILIADGRILRVEEHIDAAEDCPTLEAAGLTILPGLVDACVRSGGYADAWLCESAVHAGVTTGLLLPPTGGDCQLIRHSGLQKGAARLIDPESLTDAQLADALSACHSEERRPLLPIRNAQSCQRVLSCNPPAGTILSGLSGCERLVDALADAGVGAVIGVTRGNERPWHMAAALADAGVPAAVSCFHPAAKLTLLPVCASLCVRDGLAREKALPAITRVPADMLALPDCGRIAPGCRADLVIYDEDPLLLAASRLMTIADGQILQNRRY